MAVHYDPSQPDCRCGAPGVLVPSDKDEERPVWVCAAGCGATPVPVNGWELAEVIEARAAVRRVLNMPLDQLPIRPYWRSEESVDTVNTGSVL